jgi:hypothetical protein
VSRAYSTHERRLKYAGFWWENQKKERVRWEDLDVGKRTVLQQILEKQNGVVRIEFIWLRIGTSSGLL